MNIKYIDIVNALKRLLKDNYKEYNIYSEEIKQGMKRPAFHINIIPENSLNYNPFYREQKMIVDISYFSDEKVDFQSQEKNLNMANELQNVFDRGFKVKENFVTINNLEYDILERVLHTTFDLMWYNNNMVKENELSQFEVIQEVIINKKYKIYNFKRLLDSEQRFILTNDNKYIMLRRN